MVEHSIWKWPEAAGVARFFLTPNCINVLPDMPKVLSNSPKVFSNPFDMLPTYPSRDTEFVRFGTGDDRTLPGLAVPAFTA